jgi:hypothetical protein
MELITLERQIIDQKPDSMKKKALEYEEESSEEENDSSDNADEESASGEEEEGSDDQGADSEGEERSNGKPEQTKRSTVGLSSSSEQCTFDLRNLVAVNSHQLDANLLYAPKKKSKQPKENNTTIPLAANDIQVDEDELLKKAQDGCTQLISALWQLPMESSDAGPMVTLPKYQEIKIPRALVRLCYRRFNHLLKTHIAHAMFLLFCSFVASSSTQKGDKVGKVCQGTRYWYQSREAITKGVGRSHWRMDVSPRIPKG